MLARVFKLDVLKCDRVISPHSERRFIHVEKSIEPPNRVFECSDLFAFYPEILSIENSANDKV